MIFPPPPPPPPAYLVTPVLFNKIEDIYWQIVHGERPETARAIADEWDKFADQLLTVIRPSVRRTIDLLEDWQSEAKELYLERAEETASHIWDSAIVAYQIKWALNNLASVMEEGHEDMEDLYTDYVVSISIFQNADSYEQALMTEEMSRRLGAFYPGTYEDEEAIFKAHWDAAARMLRDAIHERYAEPFRLLDPNPSVNYAPGMYANTSRFPYWSPLNYVAHQAAVTGDMPPPPFAPGGVPAVPVAPPAPVTPPPQLPQVGAPPPLAPAVTSPPLTGPAPAAPTAPPAVVTPPALVPPGSPLAPVASSPGQASPNPPPEVPLVGADPLVPPGTLVPPTLRIPAPPGTQPLTSPGALAADGLPLPASLDVSAPPGTTLPATGKLPTGPGGQVVAAPGTGAPPGTGMPPGMRMPPGMGGPPRLPGAGRQRRPGTPGTGATAAPAGPGPGTPAPGTPAAGPGGLGAPPGSGMRMPPGSGAPPAPPRQATRRGASPGAPPVPSNAVPAAFQPPAGGSSPPVLGDPKQQPRRGRPGSSTEAPRTPPGRGSIGGGTPPVLANQYHIGPRPTRTEQREQRRHARQERIARFRELLKSSLAGDLSQGTVPVLDGRLTQPDSIPALAGEVPPALRGARQPAPADPHARPVPLADRTTRRPVPDETAPDQETWEVETPGGPVVTAEQPKRHRPEPNPLG